MNRDDGVKLTSPAFSEGARIPHRYSCDGENVNPALTLSGLPKGAKSIALVLEDPDAPMGTFVHWIAWDIPVLTELPERSTLGVQGLNTPGRRGYMGPVPAPWPRAAQVFIQGICPG